MTSLRDRLERGYGMRVQRMTEGLLLAGTFAFNDVRPAYVALAMLAMQVLSPFAAPLALVWAALVRRVPVNRLGNLYFDPNAIRGAAGLSCAVLTTAICLIRWSSVPALGRCLIAPPAASCILTATVGFCAGCSYYIFARELLVRVGFISTTPEGASDVDVDG